MKFKLIKIRKLQNQGNPERCSLRLYCHSSMTPRNILDQYLPSAFVVHQRLLRPLKKRNLNSILLILQIIWSILKYNEYIPFSLTFRWKVLKEEATSFYRGVAAGACAVVGNFGSYQVKEIFHVITGVKVFQWIELDLRVEVSVAIIKIIIVVNVFKDIFHPHMRCHNTLLGLFNTRSIIFKACKWYQDVFVVFVPNRVSS